MKPLDLRNPDERVLNAILLYGAGATLLLLSWWGLQWMAERMPQWMEYVRP